MSTSTHRPSRFRRSFNRICNKFILRLKRIRNYGMWISFAASIVCLTAIVLLGGLEHTPSSKAIVVNFVHGCQIVFIVNILFNLFFFFKYTRHNNKALKWIMDIAVLVTFFPLVYPHPLHPWIPVLEQILYSPWFIYPVLGIYSVLEISYGIGKLLGHRTNPSLLLASSFLFFIIIGSLVLMLPKLTYNGISYVDSLFVATSAVSITGLTPVEISEVFTPLGIVALGILIQIGALGVLTFTSFFALFFTGNNTLYSQLMVKDMVYSKNSDALLPTLLYVFLFTLAIEAAGAFVIYFTLPDDFPITETPHKILFSAFQSVSAFCNAGFTWLDGGMSNPALMGSNQAVYIAVGVLVMLGSIGFPILVNFKNIGADYLRRAWIAISRGVKTHRTRHMLDVNTRIVLYTSLWLTAATIALFLIFEWDNTLHGMSLWDKIAQAFFNSSIPRSSGFASVNPASFMPSTLLLVMFLMWIGGASQSTGGGIKVNTFAAMLLNLKSIVTDRKYITVFRRTISVGSVRRANSVVGLSIISYFAFSFVLVIIEPRLSVKALLFESSSALFTVGSSLGITSCLGTGAKLLLCLAMFTGRVGLLSLLMGICGRRHNDNRIYPYDNIIIN